MGWKHGDRRQDSIGPVFLLRGDDLKHATISAVANPNSHSMEYFLQMSAIWSITTRDISAFRIFSNPARGEAAASIVC